MMCESSRQRLQHTSASQVVRAVEQSRAFLARELVQQLVSQKKFIIGILFLGEQIFCRRMWNPCCRLLRQSQVTVDLERLEESRAFPARELVTMGEPNQPQPSPSFMRSNPMMGTQIPAQPYTSFPGVQNNECHFAQIFLSVKNVKCKNTRLAVRLILLCDGQSLYRRCENSVFFLSSHRLSIPLNLLYQTLFLR